MKINWNYVLPCLALFTAICVWLVWWVVCGSFVIGRNDVMGFVSLYKVTFKGKLLYQWNEYNLYLKFSCIST